MVSISKENILKVTVFVGSTLMFIYQFYTSLCQLLNPDLIDTTELKSRDDIPPPLVTICPTNQIDATKLKEIELPTRGTENDQFYFFSGQLAKGNGTQITWGTHQNKTFEEYLDQYLETPLVKTKDWKVISLKAEKKIATENLRRKLRRKFYIGFWGYCWDLADYDVSSSLIISNYLKEKFEVFISDAEKKTFYSIDTQSQFGSKMITSNEGQVSYKVKIHKYSDIDPRFKDSCTIYEKNDYEKCVDEQVDNSVTPILGCNPPWISKKNHCTKVVDIYDIKERVIWSENMFPFVYNHEKEVERNCPKSCDRIEYYSRIKQTFSMNPYMVDIHFEKEVPFTRKIVTYNFSNFLVEIGSALGLWFGLSVFGLTDLAIQIVVNLKNIKKSAFVRK